MSDAEHPDRLAAAYTVTVDDVRQLMGASTPHFALQIRDRIQRLIAGLPTDHAARVMGEREIERLNKIAVAGEVRGAGADDGLPTLPSVTDDATV